MTDEFEIINNPSIAHLNLFIVDVSYRRPHFHTYFEVCLVLEGNIRVISRDGICDYSENEIFIFNPDQVHELQSPGEHRSRLLSLQVSHKLCESYFPLLQNIHFLESDVSRVADNEKLKQLQLLLIGIGKSYFNHKPGYELLCVGEISIFFYHLLSSIPYRSISGNEKKNHQKYAQRLNRILEYIDENFTEKLLLSEIARKEELSLSYLSRFFKENLHVTFEEYLSNLRFEKAKILLGQTEMNVLEVSLESGFPDSRNLNKIFRRRMNCSVKEFKQRIKEGMSAAEPRKEKSTQRIYSEEESAAILQDL